jgi:hypothetical protein
VNPKEAGLNQGSGKPSRSGTELSSETETETETGLRVRDESSAVFFLGFFGCFFLVLLFSTSEVSRTEERREELEQGVHSTLPATTPVEGGGRGNAVF